MATNTDMCLSFIRNRGTEVVDRELIHSRGNIWDLESDMDNLPGWMALEPSKNLVDGSLGGPSR